MKSRDFQRSVKAQRFDRSAGDAPSIGRVSRMPRITRRKKRRRAGERTSKSRSRRLRRRVIFAWSLVFAVITFGALSATMWLWLRDKHGRQTEVAAETGNPADNRVASRFPSPSEDDALSMVKRAMSIRSVNEVPHYFRPGSASAEEIVDFLRTMHQTDGDITDYQWLSSMDANGLLLDGVMVSTAGDGPARNRLALLTPDDNGAWRIDFEAFARTVKPPWPDFLEKGVERGVVRVIVTADSYYNGPFRSEEDWTCYGMASPDMDQVLNGYCRNGSPQAASMEVILRTPDLDDGPKPLKRVILELRRVEGSGPRQFEITRVLAEDWVMAAKPFDEAFQ